MLYLIIGLFAVAAVLGLLILKNLLTNKSIPRTTVYLHGVFAATALVLLVISAFKNPAQGLRTSLILFVIAALGGFFMFFRDVTKRGIPRRLAVVHALLAVSGFVFLLVSVLK